MGPRPEPPPHASRTRSRQRPRPRGGRRPLRFPTTPNPRRSSPCSRSLPVLPPIRFPDAFAGRGQGDPRPAGLRRDLPASSPVALAFAAPAATLLLALPLEPLLTLTPAHLPHPAPRLDVDLLAPQTRLDLLRLLDRALAHHQLFLPPRPPLSLPSSSRPTSPATSCVSSPARLRTTSSSFARGGVSPTNSSSDAGMRTSSSPISPRPSRTVRRSTSTSSTCRVTG